MEGEKPDAVILAVGSRPIVPPLPGIERAIVVNDYYLNKEKAGDCIRPANITKAIYEGYHAGLDV